MSGVHVRVTGTLVEASCVFFGHGIRTSSTPLSYVAFTSSATAPCGSTISRSNSPYRNSERYPRFSLCSVFCSRLGVDPDHAVGRGDLDVLVRVDVGQLRPHHEGVTVVELLHPEPLLTVVELEQPPPPLPRDRRPLDTWLSRCTNAIVASIPCGTPRCRCPHNPSFNTVEIEPNVPSQARDLAWCVVASGPRPGADGSPNCCSGKGLTNFVSGVAHSPTCVTTRDTSERGGPLSATRTFALRLLRCARPVMRRAAARAGCAEVRAAPGAASPRARATPPSPRRAGSLDTDGTSPFGRYRWTRNAHTHPRRGADAGADA